MTFPSWIRPPLTLFIIAATACAGPQGEPGAKGDTGTMGNMGAMGNMGNAGATTFAGLTDKLTDNNIANNSISGTKLADDTLAGAKLSDGSISGAKLVDGTIAGAKFSDAAITSVKLADGAVIAAKLADAAITSVKLADGAVTAAKLADGVVTTAKLGIGAVDSLHLQDRSVTADKLSFRPAQACSAQMLTPDFGAGMVMRDNFFPVMRLADTSQPRAFCVLTVPNSATSPYYRVRVSWASSGTTGQAALGVAAVQLNAGTSLSTLAALGPSTYVTLPGTAGTIATTDVPVTLGNSGGLAYISVQRDATDLSDTATAAIDVLAVELLETPP